MNTPEISFGPARLEVSELSCQRGYRMLFEDLGFSVESGQALQVKGANGAGKTSLLRILATLGYAEQGHIIWNGEDIAGADNPYRTSLAFLGHKPALKSDLTANENLLLHAKIHYSGSHAPADEKLQSGIGDALGYYGIGKARNRPVRQLSRGQRQRAALARVLASGMPLWLLDEPATALDDQGNRLLCSAIDRHLQRNGMVVFSSHQSLAISAGPVASILID